MKLELSQAALVDVDVDLLSVLVPRADFARASGFKQLDAALDGELTRVAKLEGFTGQKGQALTLHTFGKVAAKKLRIAAFAGKEPSVEELHLHASEAAKAAQGLKSVGVFAPASDAVHLRALAEGLKLGEYNYAGFLNGVRKPKAVPRGVVVLGRKLVRADRDALAEASAVADAVLFARDLVNGPPNVITASSLSSEAKRVAREYGLHCSVWGKAEIAKHGMHLLLAVNAGSDEEPRFIHLTHKPKPKRVAARGSARERRKIPCLVFVGKGLTFDAGGLSIKGAKPMEIMKSDMAGGATTLAIVLAVARLQLPVEVHALVPATDNMLGGKAFKPGDVYRTLAGTSVEVLDTDAEGRLILADALVYARSLNPTVLIDHGTLTGDCIAALGQWRAGLYASEDRLRDRYLEAAERGGEAFWPLPLDDDLKTTIESPIADIRNVGAGHGGSIAAALFLREFVGDAQWLHLDIAGPAFLPEAHGAAPKGGTGFGVRTALEFVKSYS